MKIRNLLIFPFFLTVILGCGTLFDTVPAKNFNPADFNPYRGKLADLPGKKLGTFWSEKYELKKVSAVEISGASEAVEAQYEIHASQGSSYAPRTTSYKFVNFPTAAEAEQFIQARADRIKVETTPNLLNRKEVGKVLSDSRTKFFGWTNGSLYCEAEEFYYRLANF